LGFTSGSGEAVLNPWISPDGHYAFVEFRSPEEASRGINALGSVAIYG